MVISSLKLVEADLLQVEEQLVALLEKRGGVLKGPAEMMFRGGGKRLRPALVLLSARLFGPQPEAAISIAAAVEMVHGASLIHDDVIDDTDLRRGQPTMKALSGNRIAVLLGDLLLCQALLAVAELDRVVLVQVVSQAVADMTAGQILELRQQGNVETQVNDYLRMIEGKTAALMEAGCRLGALLTDATKAQVEACGQFGLNLGMAFQISDDVLDIWGNPEKLGKPTGSDLRERKYTLPFLYAYQQSLKPQRNMVRQLLTQEPLEPGAMQALVQWMDQHHSREHAMELAEKYIGQARAALRQTPAGTTRTTLEELLDYVVTREH
ncbi:MAG: polyprenyl synthetase family protein [Candidatus Eremiobacteraeota bacterium]|nr:polyprenyl synthetase family protein [Candidatus Eremiobacteraeota bacterium]